MIINKQTKTWESKCRVDFLCVLGFWCFALASILIMVEPYSF
jgi:hypothetical protein